MDQIITRDAMRARGRDAHAAGKGYDDHGMNPWAPAVKEWQTGWKEAEYEANRSRESGNQQLVAA